MAATVVCAFTVCVSFHSAVPVTVDNQYVPPSIDSVPVVVHPGPLVCMVDLLPGVHPSVVNIDVSSVRVLEDEEVEEDSAAASRAAGQKGRGRSGYENVSLKKRPPSTVGKGMCVFVCPCLVSNGSETPSLITILS